MRIRVQLLAPFADAKLLLPLPDSVQTITDVKKFARQSLSSLRELAQSSKDLLLEIDGFELLPGSLVKDVVEDKDVVTIRLRAGSSRLDSGGKSKKRESSDISGDVKRRRLVKDTDSEEIREPSAVVDHPAKVEPTVSVKTRSDRSSSSSSSSSSASSSSSSSASSNSSSGTDSSTSSSSSSEDSDLAIKDKPSAPLRPPTLPAVESSAPRIPPGQGKSATHERNERRKRARQLQKLEARNTTNVTEGESAPEQLSSNGHANSNGDMVSYITSELPVPRSMANRNKKRGFLKEMMDVQGSKTVFGFGEDAQGSSTPLPVKAVSAAQSETATPSVVDSTPTRATPRTAASKRVVPPSEMDLPSNVFVTHQVYERPGYGYAPKARRGRVRYDDSAVFDTDKEDLRPAAAEKIIVEQGETGTTMEAREPEVQSMPVQVGAEVAEEEEEDIWTKAETHFEALVPVTSQSVPSKGTKIVWKELQLDMYSFSPQLKIQLGEIVDVSGGKIGIDRLARLDADEDDPYNGQERGLVIVPSDLDAEIGRYRLV